MPTPLAPTRLIEPGSQTTPRTAPAPGGLIDLRTVPLDPIPDPARHYAVAAVGAGIGTEFDVREILGPQACPPGAVLVTYGAATAPGSAPGHAAVVVGLAEAGRVSTIALWPGISTIWPEVIRPTVVFGARHRPRRTR